MQTYGLLTAHVSKLLGDKSQARAVQTVIMRPVTHQLAEERLWSYKLDLFPRNSLSCKEHIIYRCRSKEVKLLNKNVPVFNVICV